MKQGLSTTAGMLALIVALAWALSPQAQAQNAGDQAAAGAADQGATNIQAGSTAAPAVQSTAENDAAGAAMLQEVVVTAERRAVNIQETPIVVTAVEGDQLQSLHINQISDLQTTVPGFQSDTGGGESEQNNIRGVGTSAFTAAIQSGTKIIRDGIVLDADVGLDQPMFDVSDVEVLEGPQGTFVGSSAIGGAVEITSVNPNFNGLSGYVLTGAGNYQDVKLQGAVNLPVNETFAMRLAFDFEQENSFSNDIGDTLGGFYYNTYSAVAPQTDGPPHPLLQGSIGSGSQIDPGSVNDRALRLKALWKPTDNFQALSNFEYSTSGTDGLAAEPNPATYQNLFAYPGGCSTVAGTTFAGSQEVCPGPGVTEHSAYYYPGEKPFVLDYYGTADEYNSWSSQLSEELRYTLPDGIVVRSLSGLWHLEQQLQSGSVGPEDTGWTYHPNGPDYFGSQEIDLISPTTGKLTWVAGTWGEYRHAGAQEAATGVSAPYQPDTPPTVYDLLTLNGATGRAVGVFGQLNWQFTDTLQLQVGARENWDNNAADNLTYHEAPAAGTLLSNPNGTGVYSILYTAAACGTLTPPCYKVVAPSAASGHYTDAVPTGKVDLNWTPLPAQNFYLFYARGYSAGGVNPNVPDHPVFQPETVNDWEGGWKGRVLDGHMLTQIGVYYELFQNYAYPVEDTEANNDTSVGSYIANFAPSTIKGVSVAEQSRFGGLGVDFSFDYNHTRLGNISTVNNGAFPAGFGSPLSYPQCLPGHTYTAPLECFNYTPYLANISGEPMTFAPEIQANIAVDYLFHVGVGTLDPRVTYGYTGNQYGSIYENSYNEMGIRELLGASINWVVGKWDTQLWSTNLNNETYLIDNGGSSVYYGPPRQFGIQVHYRF